MAPIEKRTAEESLEEPVQKAQKVEDEEVQQPEEDVVEDEEEDDEDDDEDDDDEFDEEDEDSEEWMDEDEANTFSLEDFPDIEGLTKEQLDTFSTAFDEFVEDTTKMGDEAGKEPMTLQDPAQIRPLPQSCEEIKKQVVVVMLDTETSKKRSDFCDQLEEASAAFIPIADGTDEMDEEAMKTLYTNVLKKKLEAAAEFVKKVDDLHSALVVMDCIFDGDAGIFHLKVDNNYDEHNALLAGIADFWKKFLAKSNEELGIDTREREGVMNFIENNYKELRSGNLCGDALNDEEEAAENPFANVSFSLE